jgi:hypothetical protein
LCQKNCATSRTGWRCQSRLPGASKPGGSFLMSELRDNWDVLVYEPLRRPIDDPNRVFQGLRGVWTVPVKKVTKRQIVKAGNGRPEQHRKRGPASGRRYHRTRLCGQHLSGAEYHRQYAALHRRHLRKSQRLYLRRRRAAGHGKDHHHRKTLNEKMA